MQNSTLPRLLLAVRCFTYLLLAFFGPERTRPLHLGGVFFVRALPKLYMIPGLFDILHLEGHHLGLPTAIVS